MIFIEKSRIPLWCIPYCLFPGCIVTSAWSLAKGQYLVSWRLTPPPPSPELRYWQNRETANVGLDSSVGRSPARQSGGRRFKSRSCKFFFVHPNVYIYLLHRHNNQSTFKGSIKLNFVQINSSGKFEKMGCLHWPTGKTECKVLIFGTCGRCFVRSQENPVSQQH